MDELQKLYDVLIRDGYYTKSFDDFKVKFQDPEYQDKVYGVVERDGLFTKGKDAFVEKYISALTGPDTMPMDNQSMISEPVKKKEESVPLWLQKQEQPKPKQEQTLPFLESKPSGISLGSQRVPEAEPIFGVAPPELKQPDVLDKNLLRLQTSLVDMDEEQAVEKLKYLYGDLGFTFDEAGFGYDAIKVTSPSGKELDLSWDNFSPRQDEYVLNQLTDFISKEGKAPTNKFNLENFYSEENKKFVDQVEINESIASVSKQADDINKFIKRYTVEKSALDKALGSAQSPDEYNKVNAQLLALESEKESMALTNQDFEKNQTNINKAIGKYIESEEKQGWFGGAGANAYLKGQGRGVAGAVGLMMDLFMAGMPISNMPDYKERFVAAANKVGYAGNDYNKIKSSLDEDQIKEIDNKISDELNKQLKYGLGTIEMARNSGVDVYGSDQTSEAYSEKVKQGFFGGALLGLAESIPSMLGPAPARVVRMFNSTTDHVAEEMQKDPDLKDISEFDKFLVSAPIGIVSSVLEEVGLRNLVANKGLLNSLTMRMLGKTSSNVTAKSFAEFVKNDVESMMARGLLTVAGASLAEFETGAMQEASEQGIKNIYNKVKGEEGFKKLAKTVPDFLGAMAYAGAQEAVGGFVLGTMPGVAAAYKKQGFEGMSDIDFEVFESIANDDKMESAFVASLKNKINSGELSVAEAKETLNDYRKSRGLYSQLPEILDTKSKKKAMNLLREKQGIEQSIKGKDEALVKRQKNRLEEINTQLEDLSKPKEDAVQEPIAEESVLRAEESQVGLQEVGEGNAKEQAPTEEVVQEEVVTPEEDLQAVLDRIEIPEDTEVLPGVDDELKTINESIGRIKEPVSREKDDQVLQDLDDKIAKAKRRIATADDADVAIEEFKQAQKEKADFEETISKKKNFSQVDGLISDEIYFRDRDKGQYEYQELFDQDPRLAALQSAKDMVEFARKNPDENINIENRESDIKILEEDIAKFPVKQAEVAPKVSSKTPKAKTPKAKSVPIPVAIPKPAPAPAPKPVAVVSQPTTKAVGLEALQEEYKAKMLAVTLNEDKSRTAKQIEERKKELIAEYQKLKAEMTAPRPKAEPEAKAAPKVEAKPAPKKAAPAPKAEPVVSKKDQEEIKKLEDEIEYQERQIEDAIEEIGNTKYNLKEALAEIKKKRDALKAQKMSADARAEAKEDLDAEIEDAKEEHDTYLEQYNDQLAEAKKEKKKAEAKLAKLQSKQVENKTEPTSVVEEEEPSYDEIKDLDPTDETNLKKMLRKLDSMDNGLGDFGRGNLSSGMAIPLARAIIKSIKVLVKAGIRIEDAISRLAIQNNLEEKDIVKMIKEVDNAQSAMKKLKDQIKAEARSATDAKNDMNQKRKNLSKVISEIEASGKISAFKAKAVINKINKLNLDSKVAVDKFIDYVGKIFTDAEYANKLNTAKALRSDIRKLSKTKEKFANLRNLGSKFASIDPSMVEDIDEYNEMAILIRDSISGSTTRKADVKFANMIKESDAMSYINKAMETQQKVLLSQKQAEVQELLDIDASDLTYDQLMELVNDDKPLTKYNEGLIRAAINKAFKLYSSMIDASMRNGKDVFTDEDVPYTTNQKKVVKEFMSMDLNVLSPKQALESVDALMNFLQSQSIAKMESVLAKYKGETEMRAIEKKGIKAKPVRKYWSKGLGRLLLEQTANLPIVFERMFGGFTKGGMVEDAMGITALKNGKSKAQSESNNIVNNYVDKFYKLKPNGEVFNTAFNNIERGMVAFMSRNVIGTDSETKVEFKRRRDLIEESIAELEKGNEQEIAKAKVYQEVYDKILKDSDSIGQVQSKAAPENLEAVKFWQEEWSDKYEQLSDTALSVYNKRLEKDINYTPDRYSKLSSDTGEIDITTEDMGFLVNSGTAPLYKKETGVLMAATRPESLPKSKGTSKTNRYIDLSFDNTNSNAMYDALVDINTAAPIRQVQSALNSDAFARIMKGTGDEKLIKNRIDLYVRNIRNKNPFSNDEFSKAVKNLNRLASVGVGQALGGVLQPVKQVAPIAMNTVINAGGLDIPSIFDLAKQKFMDKSGYAIGNRGVESQAQIESLNKMIEEAAKSKPEQAIKAIEKINNWWLKSFLVKPDVYIARASWMTYYEQSLKKQGIDPASIDYNTHEINEEAANYAQRQVDRQQNVSDSDLAGALLSDKDASKQLFVKVLMPFASFRMNQSARLGSDLSTIMDKTATKEDKEIATRSIGGFAVEMAVFRAVSAASALLIAAVVKGVMGRDDDEEKDKKKNDAIVKGQLTSTVADVFSPTPLLDKGIQLGASAVLDATQDALDISEEEKLEIYSGNKQDFFQSLGLLGISGARASQLYEMSVLAAGGSYEDDYGRKKYLSEKDRDAIATLIPIAIVSNIGLAPSEVNSIVRSSLADAKRSGTTVESEQSKSKSEESKIMGLNKGDLKRYYPDIYEQYYGEGTPDAERRKLEQEQSAIEQKTKDEYYNYVPKQRPKKGAINRGGINRGGINRGSTGSK